LNWKTNSFDQPHQTKNLEFSQVTSIKTPASGISVYSINIYKHLSYLQDKFYFLEGQII